MANRNYQELFNDDMILVSKKKKWVIQKDDLYYYKILNLENHATINQEA